MTEHQVLDVRGQENSDRRHENKHVEGQNEDISEYQRIPFL